MLEWDGLGENWRMATSEGLIPLDALLFAHRLFIETHFRFLTTSTAFSSSYSSSSSFFPHLILRHRPFGDCHSFPTCLIRQHAMLCDNDADADDQDDGDEEGIHVLYKAGRRIHQIGPKPPHFSSAASSSLSYLLFSNSYAPPQRSRLLFFSERDLPDGQIEEDISWLEERLIDENMNSASHGTRERRRSMWR
ncbi:hypothetical protein TSMEX_006822 [Taenia solium]|eukprot:TsM_001086700 transcript=TsM_001086700 gene=TsM_001086700